MILVFFSPPSPGVFLCSLSTEAIRLPSSRSRLTEEPVFHHLQTGGLVPRRVTLTTYTSTGVLGCFKRLCPRPRIWRKNGSTSACPSASRAALPPGVGLRAKVSRIPAVTPTSRTTPRPVLQDGDAGAGPY